MFMSHLRGQGNTTQSYGWTRGDDHPGLPEEAWLENPTCSAWRKKNSLLETHPKSQNEGRKLLTREYVMRMEPEGQGASWVAEHEDNHSTRCSKDPFSSAVNRGMWERTVQTLMLACLLDSLLCISLASRASAHWPHSSNSHSSGFVHFLLFFCLTLCCTCQTLTGLTLHSHVLTISVPRFDFSHKLVVAVLVTVGNWPLSRKGKNCCFCSNVTSSPVIS